MPRTKKVNRVETQFDKEEVERVDCIALAYICLNWERLDVGKAFDPITCCMLSNEAFLTLMKNVVKSVKVKGQDFPIGLRDIKYKRGELGFGRLNCKSHGYINISRVIRHTLCNVKLSNGNAFKRYADYDMKNSHPYIYLHLCNIIDEKCDGLLQYIEQRDHFLSLLKEVHPHLSKDEVKQAFLSRLNGGSASDITVDVEGYWGQYCRDVDRCRELIFEKLIKVQYPQIINFVKNRNADGENTFNFKAKCISKLLEKYEDEIRECLEVEFERMGVDVSVHCYDGIQSYIGFNKIKVNDLLLKEVSRNLTTKMGFEVQIVEKAMNEGLIIPSDFYNTFDFTKWNSFKKEFCYPQIDDLYAGKMFIRLIGDENIMRVINKFDGSFILYLFNQKTGRWIVNDERNNAIRDIALTFGNKLKFEEEIVVVDEEGNETSTFRCHNYIGQNSKLNAMTNMVVNLVREVSDIKFREMNLATKEKLLFKNGVLDMKTLKLEPFSSKYFFLNGITRDYIDYKNNKEFEELKKLVNKLCFEDAFDLDGYRESGEFLKIGLGFGLAGRTDIKNCFFNIGDTNCGKSLLTQILKLACDEYVSTFDANNFILQKNEDEAKALKWLYDKVGKRIMISNEMKRGSRDELSIKFDIELLKKIVGGGDTLNVRKLNKNEVEIINQALFIFMLNDSPTYSNPNDEAFRNRAMMLEYKVQFLNESEINETNRHYVKSKDTTIMEKFVKNDMWKDALLNLLLEQYKIHCNSNLKDLQPNSIKEANSDWLDDGSNNASFRDLLLSKFDITNLEINKLSLIEAYNSFSSNEVKGMSKTKFGKEVRKCIALKQPNQGKVWIGDKVVAGFIGIKVIE